MKEVIFLVVSQSKVERMTKNLPQLYKGEIPIKLVVEVEPNAYREPTIERHIHVEDWREGIDIADVDFRETTITEAEAEMIRRQRLERMSETLERQGYKVVRPEVTEQMETSNDTGSV